MAHRTQHTRWALAALGLGWLALAASSPGQGKDSGLAGSWKLNAEKTRQEAKRISDAPALSREDGLRNSGANRRTGSNTGGAGGAEGGGAGGGGAGGGGRASLGPLGLYARPLPELVIVQTDSTITISDPSGTPRVYRIDGKKWIEPLLGADSLEIVAKWKDGKLTTDRKLGRYGAIREAYSVDAATKGLIVEVKLSAPQLSPPMEMRWFYEPAPGTGGGGN